MKYKIKKAKKDDPIYKKGFTISSIKDYFQSKKDRGLKPLFFEKIGDKNSSRDEKLQNLIFRLLPVSFCKDHITL